MSDAGDVLADRFELIERIGRGGMSEVFRARDLQLGREVAVKILAAHLLDDPSAVRQLDREARAAAAIRHPGIVGVYDSGREGETHYLVMELVEGRTLGEVLVTEGPFPPARAVAVAVAVAEAVQAAHEQGIVHRDLKPSNVLFDVDGRVRVTDFGIAHAMAATTTETAMMAGSAPYLSPEQADGQQPRPTADVYALGCLLFEMVTGRPPFVGPTAAAVIATHIHAEPVAPSSLRPEVPAAIDAVVARALSKDPADRQPDAGAFAHELQHSDAATIALAGPVASDPPSETVPFAEAPSSEAWPAEPAPAAVAPRPVDNRAGRGWWWAAGAVLVAVVVAAIASGLTDDEVGDPAGPASEEPAPEVTEPAVTEPAVTEPAVTEPATPSPTLAPSPASPTASPSETSPPLPSPTAT